MEPEQGPDGAGEVSPAREPLLDIPADYIPALQRLRDLDDESFGRLVAALTIQPPLVVRSDLLAAVSRALPQNETSLLIDALVAIEQLRVERSWTREEVATAVSEARQIGVSDEDRSRVAERLHTVLGTPSLPIAAKALDLLFANERLFESARIVTDVRPVFGDNPQELPRAAVVIHVLQLIHLDGADERSLFVALDDDDLQQLKSVVERAEDKAETLRKTLESAGLLPAGWEA